MPRGDLFILSAPSGTGKTTLIHAMLRHGTGKLPGLFFSVSHTTRAPRRNEVDGTDYHFVDRATFKRMIDDGAFVEHAEYNQNLYGTSRREVEPRLERGEDVILEIEVQGTRALREKGVEALYLFIMPPSLGELENRLRKRGSDDEESIHRRLEIARHEMDMAHLYDHVLINRDLDATIASVRDLIGLGQSAGEGKR